MSVLGTISNLVRKDSTDADTPNLGDVISDPGTEEMYQSWALFILIGLLIFSLWTSYYLQSKRIQAVHESVVSIFSGMLVGLIVRLAPGHFIQSQLTFSHSYFFNILLPPIILNSGYELNQTRFFENIFSILTFAFAGTFISCIIIGVILFIWTALGLEGIDLPLVDAIGVGATLSATDPVTILSIFTAKKVDPKLYTIIFGESLLNDAVCIVVFETTQKLRGDVMTFGAMFRGVGIFFVTFTISLLIGVVMGVLTALILKHTRVRRYPQIESCLVFLFAYITYFFSNGCHMSGIVSLLFTGITLRHYAYYNMTRRTQLAIKYVFQLLAQLSENFIFIYLGLTLFTQDQLVFRPLLILVTSAAICISRYVAVFPLSNLINRAFRIKERYTEHADEVGALHAQEIPEQYQYMLFWAGLRGAVGVALAAGIEGADAQQLRAAVLVVVVLTVVLLGGTTGQMLEYLGIETGVEDEPDSDDEFDLTIPRHSYLPTTDPNFAYPGTPSNLHSTNVATDSVANTAEVGAHHGTRWFNELDSKVFKPVLLENDPN